MIFDPSTEMKLTAVCPDVALRWKNVRDEMWTLYQLQIKVTEGLRTFSQQWDDWGKGRLKDKNTGEWVICDVRKVITYAMPGQSFHQYGLALDSCFMGPDPYLEHIHPDDSEKFWAEYGRLCRKHGLQWGGDWKHPDRPHCEMTYGLSIDEIQIIYEDLGIKGVWQKCKQVSQCGTQLV